MKLNLAKKREGVSEGAWPGGYSVPFHITLGGSVGFSGFPEEEQGFQWTKCGRRRKPFDFVYCHPGSAEAFCM